MAEAQDAKQEQSMEEILQSIKRIIADDEQKEPPEIKTAPVQPSPMKVPESEVLELTDIVEEGRTSPAPEAEHDILKMIDAKLEVEAPPPTPTLPAAAANNDILADIDSLLSMEAAKTTANALQNLKSMQHNSNHTHASIPTASLSLRSGVTIEDLVIEALKPELRAWLNDNLPSMVERMIAAEIRKISGNN
jgi:cell pole-organizing protein PopZ